MAQATFVYDPTTARFQTEMHDVYRVLRDEFPVYQDPERRFFAISRFADVWNAVHDWATFSNDHVLEADALMPQMIYMDPPRHTELRALVSRAFTPKRMADLEPRIREVARELTDRFVPTGTCDLVADFAAPLPSTVIGEAIGVPPEHLESFRGWTEQFISITGPEDFADAAAKIYGLFGELLAERKRSPRDDLMSALIAAEIDGEHLTDEELLGFCFLLLIAGNDTTTTLIGLGAELLARHPDQRAELVADPALIPGALEEMLRIEAPTQVLPRTAMRDVELHGVTIPEGSRVMLIWGAANLDDREFDDPERFDIHRKIQRHLSFGHGAHHCLGAALARLEGRIAFEELLGRIPEYEVVGTPVHYASSWARAFQALPLRFAASP
jgi:cytochrome P450 family 130